ncbi:hypothetical protein FB645_001792 [Coemansia sp. IMI 203386]|nr:hypothetical protein FB645_001792 [Coemansia sp. IMI 203386]
MKLIDREPLEIHINLNQISLVEENGIPAKHVTFRLPPDDDESGVLPNFYSDDDDSEDTPNLPIDDDGSEGTPNLPSDDDDAEFMPYLLPVYHPGLSVHNILRAGNEYNVLSRKKKEVWRSVLNFLGFQKKNDKRVKREKNIDYSRSWLDIE